MLSLLAAAAMLFFLLLMTTEKEVVLGFIDASLDGAGDGGEQQQRTSAHIQGDFIIGALFPLHHQPAARSKLKKQYQHIKCGKIREMYGVQRVEVALQTIDKINADTLLLPNITLGIEIRDDCWYAPVALQQSIELIRDAITPSMMTHHNNVNANTNTNNQGGCINLTDLHAAKSQRGPLIGVVGPGSSSVALQVQNLLQLFHLPQVGYSTTSKDLSDKSRFNYFLRVVPSDYYQAQVILDIVRHHGWTYVSAVNTDENYGQSGIQAFRELAEEANVCIAREDSVLSTAAEEAFDKVIINLRQDPNARVVVCFCEGLTVRGLLSATKRLNMSNHFLFIGSDGWADRSDVTKDLELEAWGSISVRIHSPYVHDFDAYYWSLQPHTNLRDPWFHEFWQERFACTMHKYTKYGGVAAGVAAMITNNNTKKQYEKTCAGDENLQVNYRQDSKLSFVIKAIYTLAYALHHMHQAICGQGVQGVCDKLFPFNGSLFKNYLMNVSFEYGGDLIEFDENGDPPGRYDIMNYQRRDATAANGSNGSGIIYDYVRVGDWNNRSLVWQRTVGMQFGLKEGLQSVCSKECPKGHYKNIQQGGKDKRCCWVCVRCPNGEIIDEEQQQSNANNYCQKCPLGSVPDDNQTVCVELPIEFTQWLDTQAIIAMSFATLGFITTWFSFVVFIKYNNTPVVKSSTRELSYIILAGMGLSHASIFPILAKPDALQCALSRFLPGLSFAMIYAALLTKTNRIARILAVSKKCFPTRTKRLFMSSASQVIITLLLIGVEVVVSFGMLYRRPPATSFSYSALKVVLECATSAESILIPLAFDFFLILLCTLYALKTRNVPANFNEAKFIGFAMYTTCVIWIAFVPIYFGSDTKVITMCMCVTLTAMVTWLFLFLPKLYIIILHPERNNRSYFTTSKSIRCHIGAKVSSNLSGGNSQLYRNYSGGGEGLIASPPLTTTTNVIQKRTLSCQTGVELLQILLSPKMLLEHAPCSNNNRQVTIVPSIIERDCCPTDSCQFKNITIRLPDSSNA